MYKISAMPYWGAGNFIQPPEKGRGAGKKSQVFCTNFTYERGEAGKGNGKAVQHSRQEK
jgi:hypothetical protein